MRNAQKGLDWGKVVSTLFAGLALLASLVLFAASARAEDRSLYLYYTHTGETARITFRKNGRYDQAGLRQLNAFLRDWRRDEPTTMDPALFDLIWSVYQQVGATEPIHIVSAYRAPETNEMLRERSSAVAKNSRHTQGMAMDFFIPGVPLSKLREVAMKFQVGGVGYYPNSGSPFVHLDTGNVRAWPRMTTAQLRRLFPDGQTLHLGADGTVLSERGRQVAAAEWQKCHSVPCNGTIAVTMPGGGERGNGRTLMDLLFGNGQQNNGVQVANAPSQRQVTSVSIGRPAVPPQPMPRLAALDLQEPSEPPIPLEMPEAILVATRPEDELQNMPAPITASLFPGAAETVDSAPTPRILLSSITPQPTVGLLSAYAPLGDPEPNAQRALEVLIERRANQAGGAPNPADLSDALRGPLTTASIPADSALPVIEGVTLFDSTFAEVIANNDAQLAVAAAPQAPAPLSIYQLLPLSERPVHFVAPEIEQELETPLIYPQSISEQQFAELYEPDQGDFSPSAELGRHAASMQFSAGQPLIVSTHFVHSGPTFTAAL